MNDLQVAVINALNEQPWYARRKDTLAAVSASVLYLIDALAVQNTELTAGGGIALATLVFIAQTAVHAATPGAITPSMADRLEAAAPEPDNSGLQEGALAAERAGAAVHNAEDLAGASAGDHRVE